MFFKSQNHRKQKASNSKKQINHIHNHNIHQNNINTNISIYSNNYNQQCKDKFKKSTSSATSLASSTSNKNKFSSKHCRYIDSCESDDSEMEELTSILNDSMAQYKQTRDIIEDEKNLNTLNIYVRFYE